MRSTPVTVKGDGSGITEALALTEKIAEENGLDNKASLHLRLLAEELFGLIRAIAGEVEATYWIENVDRNYEIHMTSSVKMDEEMREQFISASTEGKNDAAKGIIGKLRVLILGSLYSAKETLPYAMMNTVSAYPLGGSSDMVKVWSMDVYKDEIHKHLDESGDAAEAWDELEKSIIAKVADNVKVKIIGKNVEIIVYKTF